MPESVYKLVFSDPQTSKLAKNDIDLTIYTRHSVDLIGKCTFYMLNKGTKQPVKVDFYIAKEEGSVLLSQKTVFQLQLLSVKPWLEYLLLRAMLISSAEDIPKRRYMHSLHLNNSQIHHPYYLLPNLKYSQEDTPKKVRIMKTKEQIQEQYPELFEGIGWFPGEPYHIHANPSITPKQTPCRPIPVHLKQLSNKKLKKCLLPESSSLAMKQLHG